MSALEQQLFTWNGWDGDQEMMTFYTVELIRDLGQFKAGEKFDVAFIHLTKSLLQLQRRVDNIVEASSKEETFEFDLIMTAKPRLADQLRSFVIENQRKLNETNLSTQVEQEFEELLNKLYESAQSGLMQYTHKIKGNHPLAKKLKEELKLRGLAVELHTDTNHYDHRDDLYQLRISWKKEAE